MALGKVGKFRCGNNTQRTESLSYNPPFNRFCRCQRRCRLFSLAGVGGGFFWPHQILPPPPYHFLSYVPNFRLKALRKLRCCPRKSFSVGKFRCGNNTQRTESISYKSTIQQNRGTSKSGVGL